MKNTHFLSFISCIGAACVSVFMETVTVLTTPIIFLFDLVFPIAGDSIDRSAPNRNTESADRMSQTGKSVWAFVTNLFSVEGRTYCHQGGGVA